MVDEGQFRAFLLIMDLRVEDGGVCRDHHICMGRKNAFEECPFMGCDGRMGAEMVDEEEEFGGGSSDCLHQLIMLYQIGNNIYTPHSINTLGIADMKVISCLANKANFQNALWLSCHHLYVIVETILPAVSTSAFISYSPFQSIQQKRHNRALCPIHYVIEVKQASKSFLIPLEDELFQPLPQLKQPNNNSNILTMPNNQFPPSTPKHPFFKIRLRHPAKPRAMHSLDRQLEYNPMIRIRTISCEDYQEECLPRAKTEECPTSSFEQTADMKKGSATQELQRELYRLKTSNLEFGRWQFSPLRAGQTSDHNHDHTPKQSQRKKRLSYRPSPKIINTRLAKFHQEVDEQKQHIGNNKKVVNRIHDNFSRMLSTLRRKKWAD